MSVPTFGMILRGARLGYHWTPQLGGFMRLSDAGNGKVAVRLHPPTLIPCARGRRGAPADGDKYYVWWEAPSLLDALLEAYPPLRTVKAIKRPIYFEVPHAD